MSSSFRLSARNLFLTYPHCDAKSSLFEFLQSKFADSLSYCIVAREAHQSGEPHLHAVVCLSRKTNFKSPQCLDFDGHHGDYKPARDVDASITYCKKDDTEPLIFGVAPESRGLTKRRWAEALGAESIDNFMDAVASADPKSFIIFNDKIEQFARKKFRAPETVYTDPFPSSWLSNTQMDSWALDNITNWSPSQAIRPKSLILVSKFTPKPPNLNTQI